MISFHVVFSLKLGADHKTNAVVSKNQFDEGRYLPLSSVVLAIPASRSVIENVFWKPSWSLSVRGISS